MRVETRLAGAFAGLACLMMAGAAAASDMISEPIAVLQGLDKITARVSEFDAPVGGQARFGNLSIMVRACKKNPPEDRPENAVFLQIYQLRPGEPELLRFSGWMFAESPALSSLEDPIYDVILLDCRAASGSPAPASAPGNNDGNVARPRSAAPNSR